MFSWSLVSRVEITGGSLVLRRLIKIKTQFWNWSPKKWVVSGNIVLHKKIHIPEPNCDLG